MIDSTGPKISSLRDGHSGVTSAKTVGLDEEALSSPSGGSAPPVKSVGPLADALVDVAADPIALGGRHQRPEAGALVERVARR